MLNVCLNMVGKRKNLDTCPHRTSGHLGNLTALVSVESWRGSLELVSGVGGGGVPSAYLSCQQRLDPGPRQITTSK